MMIYDYAVEFNSEFGSWGLVPTFMEHAEPGGGTVAAHDLLEHFPGDLDTDNEAMALGAILHVRPYHLGNCGDPGYIISSDIAMLWFNENVWGELTDPGASRRIRNEEVEEWIDSALHHAREELEGEEDFNPKWLDWARGWIRKGYRKARKRYPSMDSCTLGWHFKKLAEKLDEALMEAASSCEVENVIVRVKLVRKDMSFSVSTIYPHDPEHPYHEEFLADTEDYDE